MDAWKREYQAQIAAAQAGLELVYELERPGYRDLELTARVIAHPGVYG
jgi:hypothetical protein